MPIAYQEQAQLTCPACGADFEAAVWLILDAQEEPAAAEALRRGELNLVACPACGTNGPAGAPLLFHDGAARRVIFAPAPGAAEHEWREQARDLHAVLVGSIPEEQRRPYLADVDIAQDLAGVAHLLKRMESRVRRPESRAERPETGDQRPETGASGATSTPEVSGLGSRVSGLGSPVSGPSPASEQSEQAPPLLLAVQSMLAADSPEELDAVLAAYPILLDASTDATLAQLAEVAVEQRAYEIADSLRRARQILAQMAEAAGGPAADPAAAVELATPALTAPALQALLQAQSGEELAAVAAIHPLLLRPEVDALLAEQVDLALDEGNERLAQAVEERREALAVLRAAQAAESAADEPTLDEAIEALLIAEGEDALAEVIDRYPVLLDDVAAQALWQFAAEARASGDEELARYAVECREMLRRVREGLEE